MPRRSEIFFVPGKPVSKARPRFTKQGHTFTDKGTKQGESNVLACYASACGMHAPHEGSVALSIVAADPVPTSRPKWWQAAALDGSMRHTKRPDLDNALKLVMDALNGVAYKDDSQIDRIEAVKRYGTKPGVFVTLRYDDEVSRKEYEEMWPWQ
jgi:Holliday junction resolvase RusA-like endonuclease